ncbi:hypothetical protein BJ742DRAFT_778623 [Cladochytrium replicatum]|nr:hypothetical protein BJ742DRAFT_778623 [Cladochytrium replicatum]
MCLKAGIEVPVDLPSWRIISHLPPLRLVSRWQHRRRLQRDPEAAEKSFPAVQAMGINASTSAPSMTVDVTWELMAILIDMKTNFVVRSLKAATQIQLLSENLSVR